jgi:hypothetical protein
MSECRTADTVHAQFRTRTVRVQDHHAAVRARVLQGRRRPKQDHAVRTDPGVSCAQASHYFWSQRSQHALPRVMVLLVFAGQLSRRAFDMQHNKVVS